MGGGRGCPYLHTGVGSGCEPPDVGALLGAELLHKNKMCFVLRFVCLFVYVHWVFALDVCLCEDVRSSWNWS